MNYYINYSSSTGTIITRYVEGVHDALIASPPAGTANLLVSVSDAMMTANTTGYTVVGGVLVAPPAPTAAQALADAQTAQMAKVDAAANLTLQANFVLNGNIYYLDPQSQALLNAAIAMASIPGTLSSWTTSIFVQNASGAGMMVHTQAQVFAVAQAWNTFNQATLTQRENRNSAIKAITTATPNAIAAVQAINF